MQRVLVLGGYGAFGGLAAERLARVAGIEVIVAGRSGAKAESFAARLAGQVKARISAARLDARDIGAAALRAIALRRRLGAICPESGVKPTCHGRRSIDAIDPRRTCEPARVTRGPT